MSAVTRLVGNFQNIFSAQKDPHCVERAVKPQANNLQKIVHLSVMCVIIGCYLVALVNLTSFVSTQTFL